MSISFYWPERGGRWGSSPLTSLADYQKLNVIQKWGFHILTEEGWWMGFESINQPANHQKLNVIQKWAFHFFGGRGWQMGFKSIEQPGWSSDVECNTKTSISCFQLERSGGWGLSPSTSPANHQKLNIIKIWAFHFLAGDRWWMGFKSIDKPGWSLEVEHNTKMSISFLWLERGGGWGLSPLTSPANHQKLNVIQKVAFHFLAGEGWQMGFESINQPSRSSEVERNPKSSISFFWLERAGRWGSSPSTSHSNYQKLNIIQKWAFHFLGWRGVVDGVRVHWPARLIIRSWM